MSEPDAVLIMGIEMALDLLHTEDARIELLEHYHYNGNKIASRLLLKKYEAMQDDFLYDNEGNPKKNSYYCRKAGELAFKLGDFKKAKDLLIKSSKIDLENGDGSFIDDVKALIPIDKKIAYKIYYEFEKDYLKKIHHYWRAYFHPLATFADYFLEDSRLQKKYLKQSLKGALKEEHLTVDEILEVIYIMNQLGMKKKAKTFAKEYINELGEKNSPNKIEYYYGEDFFEVERKSEKTIRVIIKAGLGLSHYRLFIKLAKESIKNERLGNEFHVIAQLAELVGIKKIPTNLFIKGARILEKQKIFWGARELLEKAHCFDKNAKERLAKKELKSIIPKLMVKTSLDYEDFWNTLAYEIRKQDPDHVSPIPDSDLVYTIGLATDVDHILKLSKDIQDQKLKKRLLNQAVKELSANSFFNHAAKLAQEIEPSKAKKLWAKASAKSEKDAIWDAKNESNHLLEAMEYAKSSGSTKRYKKLLLRYIKLINENTEDPKIVIKESVIEKMTLKFYLKNREASTKFVELLCNKGYCAEVNNFLLKIGIIDKECCNATFNHLESSRRYKDAQKLAKKLGNKDLVGIYQILEKSHE